MVILLLVFLLLNGFAIQASEVFTYDVHWSDSIAPSYASLSRDVNLPESFILCTSSKEATFNDVGMYSLVAGAWTERKKMFHGGSFLKLADVDV